MRGRSGSMTLEKVESPLHRYALVECEIDQVLSSGPTDVPLTMAP